MNHLRTLADLPRATMPEDYFARVGPFLAGVAEEHGPIFAADWPHGTVVYMVGPEANRFVLLSGREHFSHDLGWTPLIGEALGRGLLNMDGPDHTRGRKMMVIAQPTP